MILSNVRNFEPNAGNQRFEQRRRIVLKKEQELLVFFRRIQLIRKRRLFIGILFIALIVISLFVFLLGRNLKLENAVHVDQEETMNLKDVSPAIEDTKPKLTIDDTKLKSVIADVPEYYTIFFDETVSSHLSYLLDYVKNNVGALTQETIDAYAKEIEEILKSFNSSTDVPLVYIKVNNEGVINKEYTFASIAIIDSKGGKNEDIVDLSANIKIRGNSTTEVAKKTYTIKFSKKENVLGMGSKEVGFNCKCL